MMKPPTLPLGARALNRLGQIARSAGVPILDLDADDLIARAERRSGLSEPGDNFYREGLGRLVDSLEGEAALTPLGRLMAREEIVKSLSNRLDMADWHARNPDIAKGRIDKPIFIVGQGRTGTTILHELMTLDPNNRVPLTWECEAPCPPPERENFETDPRIEQAQRALDRSEDLIPDFKKIHRMGAQLPQECVRLTATEMVSLIFAATWRCPSYTRWVLDEANMTAVYAAHRKILQLLQWRCPAERWVVKTPEHLWHLDAVLAEYPDARFIQTHRDPLKVLSSLTSLEVVLRKMASDDIDAKEIAREWSEWNTDGYERSIDFRERSGISAKQIVDVQFDRFIQDPVAVMREIYEHFDLELLPDVESRMRAYVANNPDDKDGRHSHRFSATGLDVDAERAKVQRYQDYFDVPSEKQT